MRRNLLLLLLGVFSSFFSPVWADWQRPVTNYSRHDYQGGNQNWMITQHHNGWMYAANNKGMLEFDGVDWHTYSIHNAKTRAVAVDKDGNIFIGGMGQFGYFVPDELGGLQYICLSDSLAEEIHVGVIWNILINEDEVYYQSDRAIFRLRGTQLDVLHSDTEIRHSAIIHRKFYIANGQGLAVLNGDEFSPLANTAFLSAYKVVGLLPYQGKVMVVSNRDGIFLYDGAFPERYQAIEETLSKATPLFCAAILNDSLLALGTVHNGVWLSDLTSGRVEQISIDDGLQNKTVLGMNFDKEKNLWLALDNGIDCVHLNSPVRSLYGRRSPIGSGYGSAFYEGKLYLATNQGLYRTSGFTQGAEREMDFIPGTGGQVWSVFPYDGKLFCCTDNGLFIRDGERMQHIRQPRGIWRLATFPHRTDLLLAGTYSGIYILEKEEEGWKVHPRIPGFYHSCKTLFVESPYVVWVSNKGKGLFRMTLSEDMKSIEKVKNYNDASLSPQDEAYVARIGEEIVITSQEGIFRYNQIRDELERYPELEKKLGYEEGYTFVREDEFGNIWYITGGHLRYLSSEEGARKYGRQPVEAYLGGLLIENFEHIQVCDEETVIVGTEEGFSLIRYRESFPLRSSLHLQIRRVYLTQDKDSLIYGRSYEYPSHSLVIPYRDNSLRIEYSANNYDPSLPVWYTFRLLGSGNENWSAPTQKPMKEYTGLREGRYTFQLKLQTVEGEPPVTTSLTFVILPPWYRSWWALTLYVIVGSLLLAYLYYRLVQTRKRLLRQKEKEIIRQKEEFRKESERKDRKIDSLKEQNLQAELRHKSDELVRTTLNIVRKNEILQTIRKDAQSLSAAVREENMVELRRKVLRLINRIDVNLEHDNDLESFQSSFDTIHHDFFKILDERFPELNQKDKLLCAYIRMNLLSKEIAPLLNISVRGVEISRYRLRRKLGLSEKDKLAEFLHRISE